MPKPIVLAYRAVWNPTELPPAKIDYAPLTHIAHAFVTVERGAIRFPDETASRALIHTAHKHGVKVTLAIGGAASNRELSALCASEAATKTLAARIASHVTTLGYDGADIDWEHPETVADTARLSRFTRLLRQALPRPRLVTMATPSTDWNARWYDAPAILSHLDFAAVMTYDFFGSWSASAGHHSALFAGATGDPALCASAAIRYWQSVKRFPASKLLLGIPLYARGFRTKAWGDPVQAVADKTIEAAYRTLGVGATDAAAGCATWKTERGAVLMSGDNPETARQKGAWTRAHQLAGVFFWELSGDAPGELSVVRAARAGLAT